jgi:hypothetical protein
LAVIGSNAGSLANTVPVFGFIAKSKLKSDGEVIPVCTVLPEKCMAEEATMPAYTVAEERTLHWVTAALILIIIPLGLIGSASSLSTRQ